MTAVSTPDITIPADLLPADGRFGSGPTKVRPEILDALVATGTDYMGTSHRQLPVQLMVAELRNGLAELLQAPDGYEIILGNGGSTGFWDCATFGLIRDRSHHLSFGEFSSKFAAGVAAAPHLGDPSIVESEAGTHPPLDAAAGADAYCYPHNETSTGVMVDPIRPGGDDQLTLVDATSAAGGLHFDAAATDVYYFAPEGPGCRRRTLAGDGLPAAIERIEEIAGRPVDPAVTRPEDRARQFPQGPDLQHAGTGHRVPRRQDGRLVQRQRRALVVGGPLRAVGRDPLLVGRRPRLRHPVRGRRGGAEQGGGHHRLRRRHQRRHHLRRAAGQRHRGHQRLPQARPQPAPHRPFLPAIEPSDVEALTRCLDHVVAALS
ncbi:MAG: hypothetical protein R2695_10965 [Acidimicrobiales bacterium]